MGCRTVTRREKTASHTAGTRCMLTYVRRPMSHRTEEVLKGSTPGNSSYNKYLNTLRYKTTC